MISPNNKIYFIAAYRFGIIQVKVGLATILKNFEIILSEKTQMPIEISPGLLPAVKGGLWLNFKPLD